MTAPHDRWVGEILDFWFIQIDPAQWFGQSDELDREVRERFAAHHAHAAVRPLRECLLDARMALAVVVALDQFPRNMFRGTPRAFATDAKALEVAERAVAQGFDGQLTLNERMFLYMPYEHAEDATAQARGLPLFQSLGDAEITRWAVEHKEIIDRFGRFPHRNAILGRTSTPDELAFLAEPGSSF